MEPHKSSPDWLRKIEVEAEILSADSGYAQVLREILLEDLAETEQVLRTDFVPWITGVADEGQTNSAEAMKEKEMDPDFGVIADAIKEIEDLSENEIRSMKSEDEVAVEEGEMTYFSIFREFFRSYDRESKLILLDEIPEIGTEKELYFLEELFEDPDEKIASRARKVYALLARRLEIDPEAPKNKGVQTLWTSFSASATNARLYKQQTCPDSGTEKDPQVNKFAFIPEFEALPVSQKKLPYKTRRRKNRLFRFLGGTQKGTDK